MAEKNEVAKKQEFTTGLSQWTNTITGLVSIYTVRNHGVHIR